MENTRLEGRNSVLEAFKSGRTVDKLFVQENLRDGTIGRILSMAKKSGTIISYQKKEKLDFMSETKAHQGVIAYCAAAEYATVNDILDLAREKGEDPFVIILDGIEDPHNLGAVIRTANTVGAHGVIIPKHRSATLSGTVAKASAGAVNYTKVAKVTNIARTVDELRKKGLWIMCADMDGKDIYGSDLKGPIGVVIGNEGKGVSPLVRDKCDFVISIPVMGEIESLNASVACGVMCYEVLRQRRS